MAMDRLVLGSYETNCYILRENEQARQCVVIDPGLGAEQLLDFLAENHLDPVAVVLTHGHIDHAQGVVVLREEFPDIKVAIHALDSEMLADPRSNLSTMMGGSFTTAPAEIIREDQTLFEQVGVALTVLHTPRHTPGGICLYSKADGIVFTDDTLFAESVGRSDFPGGSHRQLIASIRDKLFTLPDETVVYPGHGPQTTISHEKTCNTFL